MKVKPPKTRSINLTKSKTRSVDPKTMAELGAEDTGVETKGRHSMQAYQKEMYRKEEERVVKKAAILPKTDLRSITRRSDSCLTSVTVRLDFETKVEWLVLGESHIRSQRDGRWRLEAYLPYGVTDFEHDSAYALRLPLIGMQFDSVDYQRTRLIAWVDPDAVGPSSNDFHVPGPDYNPMLHPKAIECKSQSCNNDKPWPHIMVPEGFYVPPFDIDLYRIVRGKQVEISIGPTFKDP